MRLVRRPLLDRCPGMVDGAMTESLQCSTTMFAHSKAVFRSVDPILSPDPADKTKARISDVVQHQPWCTFEQTCYWYCTALDSEKGRISVARTRHLHTMREDRLGHKIYGTTYSITHEDHDC